MRPQITSPLLTAGTALAFALALSPGCSDAPEHPPTLPVSGKVSYKGQPVTKGTVTFVSDDGQTAVGEIQPDGTYSLSTFGQNDGTVLGHHRVSVVASDADPTLMPGSSKGYKPPKDLVPKKYGDAVSSGLEATVSREKSSFDFDLK
jgi:hypothetical protein